MRHLSFITTSLIFKFLECVPTRTTTTTTFKLIDRDARGEKTLLNTAKPLFLFPSYLGNFPMRQISTLFITFLFIYLFIYFSLLYIKGNESNVIQILFEEPC